MTIKIINSCGRFGRSSNSSAFSFFCIHLCMLSNPVVTDGVLNDGCSEPIDKLSISVQQMAHSPQSVTLEASTGDVRMVLMDACV